MADPARQKKYAAGHPHYPGDGICESKTKVNGYSNKDEVDEDHLWRGRDHHSGPPHEVRCFVADARFPKFDVNVSIGNLRHMNYFVT